MPYCQQGGGAAAADSPGTGLDQQGQSSRGKRPFLKWGGIGCGGLLGLFILLVIITAIASPDSGQEDNGTSASRQAVGETAEPAHTIFDHSQDRNDLFYAYVPAEIAGSDGDVYAIAVSEYQERNEERVRGSFFTDRSQADSASCFEEPNSSGFSIPCDRKFSEHYSSHWGSVSLEQDSRHIDKRFPSVAALEADLSNWDAPGSMPAYEVVASSLFPETHNYYVLVAEDVGESDANLCAVTKSVYQETESSADLFQVFFLTSDSSLVKRARENDRESVSRLVTESIASLAISPNPTSTTTIPDPIKPYRSFYRRGAWDGNNTAPTCRSASDASERPNTEDTEPTAMSESLSESATLPVESTPATAFSAEGYVVGDVFAEEVCQEFHAWVHRGADFGSGGSVTLYGHILVTDPFHKVLIHLGGLPPEDVWGEAEREVHAGAVEMRENFLEVQAVTGVAGDVPRWAILYQTCKDRFQIDPFESVIGSQSPRLPEPLPPQPASRR